MTTSGDSSLSPDSSENSINAEQIAALIGTIRSAEECVAFATQAEQLGDARLQRQCLERAIALDRNSQAGLAGLAALSLDEGDTFSTAVLLEETTRVASVPENVERLRSELLPLLTQTPDCEFYLRAIGRIEAAKPEKTLSIVLITNLLPPQELGGYGRMMWEFARGLIARGHRVRVLTSDQAQFTKTPTAEEIALEQHVMRTLQLAGTWVGGRVEMVADRSEMVRRLRDNAARVRTALAKSHVDLVLAGNLDLLGVAILTHAFERKIPVLHALANAMPGYAVQDQPVTPHYWVAPCSDWNGEVYRNAGYTPERVETLYPGARIERFFRFFLPDTGALRICYASLVLPYKGVDTLVDALVELKQRGVEFTAEIAGDAPKPEFVVQLQQKLGEHGLADHVRFTGFLDRDALSALFARSNVLVFPSRFDEPFGISQVEAMASGLVVVSSGTGGAKEIVRDGTDGLLFSVGNPRDLARQLERLAGDGELFARLQRQAQGRAVVFSVDKAVEKIEALATEMQQVIETERNEEVTALS